MTKSMTKAQRMVLREALADGGSWWPCGIAWFGRCARGMERLGLVSIIEACLSG